MSEESGDLSSDVMLLYELSLSLGRTLDPEQLCREFINVLLTRLNMGFGGVWSMVSLDKNRIGSGDFELVYAYPAIRVRTHALPLEHPLRSVTARAEPLSHPAQQGPMHGLIHDDDTQSGAYAGFPLRGFGILVLYSARGIGVDAGALGRLRAVVDQFAVALEGAMAHSWVVLDAIEREAIIEAIPDLLFGIDSSGRLTWWNQALDLDLHDLRGKPLTCLFQQASQEGVSRALGDLAGSGRAQVDAWLATLPGDTLVELNLVRLRNGPSRNVWAVGSARDVTALRRAERRLRISEERLNLALEGANDGLWDIDLRARTVFVSPRCAAMLHYQTGKTPVTLEAWSKLVHPDDLKDLRASALDHLCGRRATIVAETRLLTCDGQWCWAMLRGKVVERDEQGKALRLVGTQTDITDRKTAELERERLYRELHQAQKMEALGHLTGGIAHDFNNILAAILGFAELARNRLSAGSTEALPGYVDQIVMAGTRGRDLVSKMLAFSRVQGGEANEPTAIVELVEESLRMLKPALPSSVVISTDFERDLPKVAIDPVQVQQALLNLLINARDAMNGQGDLEISSRRRRYQEGECSACHRNVTGEWVELAVRDNGRGIAAEHLPKIFDPFFSTKEVGRGAGMGLAVIHGVVCRAGGHVLVESRPGEGSEFRLLLPAAAPVAYEISEPAPGVWRVSEDTALGRGQHVLVVDDETALLGYMSESLNLAGFRVTTRSDSQEALRCFLEQPQEFALLITDQTMPRLTGLELIQAARRQRPDLPVVLCTGYSEVVNEAKAHSLGIDRYLAKPVSPEQLASVVADLLK
ncbi:MAG: response regulator [Chromatiales bacterium]|nr:response regulator [Chromatiales bacterium]